MWKALIILAAGLLIISAASPADVIYRWRDAKGVLHYSDTPPGEGARDVKMLGVSGQTENRSRITATGGTSTENRSRITATGRTSTPGGRAALAPRGGGTSPSGAPTPVVPPVTDSPPAPEPTPVVPPVTDSPPAPAPTPVVPPVTDSPPAPAPTPVVPPVAVSPSPPPLPQGSANLLFSSGFEGATAVNATTGGWQDIVGADSTTGFTWPGNIWGGGIKFQTILGLPIVDTAGNYIVNRIETVTGHNGNPTRALYSEIKQQGGASTQDVLMLLPASEQGDLYISYWIKLQPDLLQKMTPQNWRAVFEWKTGGDYRVIAYVASWGSGCGGVKPNGPLFWQIRGDNNANGGLPYQEFWLVDNCAFAVPVDEWLKFEVFWHRSSGADGRVWIAVNGQVIADRYGPNKGVNNAPINRIMMPNLYSGTPYPIYQWVDDVEIWDGFPPVTGSNPPYAPH